MLTSEQKVSLGIFGVCGFFAVGLSLWSLYAHVRSPFFVSRSVLEASRKALAPQNQDDTSQADAALKAKDTDHDGLSDYDEINIYHTSPYLADSDSDGIPDGVEVAQGTDPNCPKGKNCLEPSDTVPATSASASARDLLSGARTQPFTFSAGASSSAGGAEGFLQNPPDPSSLTPAQIRAYLIAHQLVTEAQLSQLSDDAVKQVYQAAYNEARQARAAATSSAP